jgi:hypothetical protein
MATAATTDLESIIKHVIIPLALALGAASALAQQAPYAGQQARAIKSLSQAQVDGLLAGEGSGYAKAAELHGYPGPAHVLEHAQALQLSDEQRQATQALMQAHKQRARELGQALVQAELTLDRAFASRTVDGVTLAGLTSDAGQREAALREEHLRTHLAQTALLSPQQIRRYSELRGYSTPAGAASAPAEHGSHHHGGHRP